MDADKSKESQNQKPLQVLKKLIGKRILVRLKSDLAYSGSLDKIDIQMNVILANAVEYDGDKQISNLGRVIIRGNNIIYVSLLEPKSQLENSI